MPNHDTPTPMLRPSYIRPDLLIEIGCDRELRIKKYVDIMRLKNHTTIVIVMQCVQDELQFIIDKIASRNDRTL